MINLTNVVNAQDHQNYAKNKGTYKHYIYFKNMQI